MPVYDKISGEKLPPPIPLRHHSQPLKYDSANDFEDFVPSQDSVDDELSMLLRETLKPASEDGGGGAVGTTRVLEHQDHGAGGGDLTFDSNLSLDDFNTSTDSFGFKQPM